MDNKIKLVIFDCDGVMFDSKEANRQYYNHMLAAFDRPAMTPEELEYVHMHHVVDSLHHIFRHYPGEFEKADAYRQQVDYRDYLQYMIIEPDLVEFLQLLQPSRRIAISTNRTTTMPLVLEMFGLAGYFEKVVTPLDVTNPKPHPEALEQILDHFKLGVEEAIYIGDSIVDREHTAGLGMPLIAFKNPALPAEYHVSRFMEIPNLPPFEN